MIIDVSERIDTAKRITAEWAEAAGYKLPDEGVGDISKMARDLQRVMNASEFGCQRKSVHSLLQILIGETFPINSSGPLADYAQRIPFAIGSCLVPLRPGSERPGIVARVSKSGRAGLRQSNGEVGQHWQQDDVRPATDAEIDRYFEEAFGLAVNEADNPPPEEQEPFVPEDDDGPLF